MCGGSGCPDAGYSNTDAERAGAISGESSGVNGAAVDGG